jgi:hypothetical protein
MAEERNGSTVLGLKVDHLDGQLTIRRRKRPCRSMLYCQFLLAKFQWLKGAVVIFDPVEFVVVY